MPRIIVIADSSRVPDGAPVLLDEQIRSVHLSTRHAAGQLIERLTWAVSDAEAAERSRSDQNARPKRQPLRLPHSAQPGVRLSVGA
jgi:hypothetical protein